MTNETEENLISGKEYDSPIILPGSIDIEPERYVGEKPYDLTRYEYSILKRNFTADFWCNLFAGATAGIFISVAGKTIIALINKTSPTLEKWELISILIGLIVSLFFKFIFKTNDDKTKKELVEIVDSHFKKTKPRRIHLTGTGGDNEN